MEQVQEEDLKLVRIPTAIWVQKALINGDACTLLEVLFKSGELQVPQLYA
jgi:aryl-phospho-beta-D-glucosidase BglC (GH1 family)